MNNEQERENEIKTDRSAEGGASDEFIKDITSLADAAGVIDPDANGDAESYDDSPSSEEVVTEKKKRKLYFRLAKNEDKLRHRVEIDGQVREILGDALDEDALDLGEIDEPTVISINLSQILSAVFGVVILGFAIFGIVMSVVKYQAYVESKNDNSRLADSLERLILPLSAADVPSFESTSLLNQEVIVTAACWDIILSPSATYTSDGSNYIVSYLEVDTRIIKLFGSGLEYTHGTVGDEELTFVYDEDTGMYTIPMNPRSMAYYPRLDDMQKTDDGYVLTVSFCSPISEWVSGDAVAEKIMLITVTQSGLGYTVSSLSVSEIVNSQGF